MSEAGVHDGWEDVVLPIFDPPPPPKKKVLSRREKEKQKQPDYRKIRNRDIHCADCIDRVREELTHNVFVYPRHAAYLRKKQGEEDRYLCLTHAQEWRDRDGLKALK